MAIDWESLSDEEIYAVRLVPKVGKMQDGFDNAIIGPDGEHPDIPDGHHTYIESSPCMTYDEAIEKRASMIEEAKQFDILVVVGRQPGEIPEGM